MTARVTSRCFSLDIKVNQSRNKQYGVTSNPTFSHRAKYVEKIEKVNRKYVEKTNMLTQSFEESFFHRAKSIKKMLKKDKYSRNQLRKAFSQWKIY